MARVGHPFLSETCSGKLGATVFFRSRYGTIARLYYPPVNPKSVSQTEYRRMHFSFLLETFTNYPRLQIQSWLDYSRAFFSNGASHPGRSRSALNCFLSCSLNRALLGLPPHYFAPPLAVSEYFATCSITYTVGGYLFSFDTPIPENCGILIRQKRNLWPNSIAPKRGPIINTLLHADESPYLISDHAGGIGGPNGAPAFVEHSQTHFHVRFIDSYGNSSTELFFDVQASIS